MCGLLCLDARVCVGSLSPLQPSIAVTVGLIKAIINNREISLFRF